MARNERRKGLLFLGLALSAALLGAILWRLDWRVFVAELRGLRFEWLAAGAQSAPYRAFWSASTIGLMITQVYPLRAGEVLRVFAIRRLAQIPLGRAATSALVDRLSRHWISAWSARMSVRLQDTAGRTATGLLPQASSGACT